MKNHVRLMAVQEYLNAYKIKGFIVSKFGRCKWQEGPRIVSYNMSDSQCECQVDKLYYLTENKDKFKVTERIKCNQKQRKHDR